MSAAPGEAVAGVLLHALRLVPAAALAPALGGPLVPPFARVAIALGLGGCAWAARGAPAGPAGLELAAAAVREAALGAVLGAIAALPIEAARATGRLADTLRGATLAELHVAPIRQRETALGDLLAQWTTALAAAGGGRLVVAALLGTFDAVPAGEAWLAGRAADAVLRGAAELLACAVCAGAPVAAGVLAADVALALALRAAPQLGVHGAAQPARAALGLAALALAAGAVAGRLTSTIALSAALVGAAAGARP